MSTPHDPSPDTDPASDLPGPAPLASRRAVLAGTAATAATAAAAALAIGLPASRTTDAQELPAGPDTQRPADDGGPAAAAVVAHVRAGSVDQIVVSSGDREVVLTDRALVRALVEGVR